MIRQLQVFALAMQFMTRVPMPAEVPFSDARQVEAARYYPVVGLLIGAIGAAVLWSAAQIFPAVVAALLSLAVVVAVTGALHEDGLADMADGLGGGTTRDRALEIMRDSAIGSYGVLALVLSLGLHVAALATLPLTTACWAVSLGHGISRYACVWAIATQSYARSAGAKFTAPVVDRTGHAVALVVALASGVALFAVIGPAALSGLAGAALCAVLLSRMYLRKLGGFTGDCLGALQQVSLLGLLLGVLAWP